MSAWKSSYHPTLNAKGALSFLPDKIKLYINIFQLILIESVNDVFIIEEIFSNREKGPISYLQTLFMYYICDPSVISDCTGPVQ